MQQDALLQQYCHITHKRCDAILQHFPFCWPGETPFAVVLPRECVVNRTGFGPQLKRVAPPTGVRDKMTKTNGGYAMHQ